MLIVGDNRDAADSPSLVLELAGYAVRVAYDGRRAVEVAREFQPAAALVDIGLPGDTDGYAVAGKLRQEPGLEGILLVAVTGYGRAEDVDRARAAGFDRHVTKPADTDLIRRLLAGAPGWRR